MNQIVNRLKRLFDRKGSSLYGGEAVTQLEHALQAATMAEASGADAATISAALLHDVGHMLHELPDDAPDAGVDDVHEERASKWLSKYFGPNVSEPVRMHVDAKRYLCAVDPEYHASLSEPSRQSLLLQGGPFDFEQREQFEQLPFFKQAVQLRRWDDGAKVVGLETPSLDHFLMYVNQSAQANAPAVGAPL
jgi:[1-hydroxy-2-(trimethylamino)ethyl]phosphonate dioxygenase